MRSMKQLHSRSWSRCPPINRPVPYGSGGSVGTWIHPFDFHGRFDEGIDDVSLEETGRFGVVEHKHGTAEIAPSQMTVAPPERHRLRSRRRSVASVPRRWHAARRRCVDPAWRACSRRWGVQTPMLTDGENTVLERCRNGPAGLSKASIALLVERDGPGARCPPGGSRTRPRRPIRTPGRRSLPAALVSHLRARPAGTWALIQGASTSTSSRSVAIRYGRP